MYIICARRRSTPHPPIYLFPPGLFSAPHTHTQEDEDVLTEGAEDDFLDPIMHTLMRDPVRLPASGDNKF